MGVLTLETRSAPQHLVARHVRQVEIEQDDVVVVELAEVDALFAEVGSVDVETFRLQHQFDALRGRAVVLNQQDTHEYPLPPRRSDLYPNRQPCEFGWVRLIRG